MAEEFRVLRPREYHSQLVSKGQRADGRHLEEVRQLKLETDAIRTADSSSLVKLGNTSLVCGCTTRLLKVDGNKEECEPIRLRVELPPICSSPTGYRTQNTAQLLTRTLRNILDDANCLGKQSFYTKDASHYWSVDVEVICLNYDGSLLDASLIAVLSALKSLTLKSELPEIPDQNISLNTIPVCCSFATINNFIICDPTLEEETVAQSTFSITIDSATSYSCHINKTGGKSLSTKDLMKCIQLAKTSAANVRKNIEVVRTDIKMDCI